MAKPFSRVRSAAIDGRLCNVYWRQGELERLHVALVEHASEIQEAIRHDTGNTIGEAKIVYLLALSCVKDQYASLDPAKELQDEHRTTNGIDSPDTRQPAGLVYIEPSSHTLLYSIVSPLAIAIASGNCVIVKLQNDARQLTGLLRNLLLKSLDRDVFDIALADVSESDLPPDTIRVLQSDCSQQPRPTDLVSLSTARTLAIVDRTANLVNAAKAIVLARFSFGGKSPYAPDVVLVNDFAMGQFLSAITKQLIQFHSERNAIPGDDKKSPGRSGYKTGPSRELHECEDISVVSSNPNGAILELNHRKTSILNRKTPESVLLVHAVSSLDDAIDLANSDGPLLAAYHFADNASCKYLGQFINSQVTFANHVPGEILVGPSAPLGYTVAVNSRYNSEMFTIPRPQYVNPSPRSLLLGTMIRAGQNHGKVAKWEIESGKLPIDTKRWSGDMMGFFERGIVTGASFVLTAIVLGMGAVAYGGLQTWRMR